MRNIALVISSNFVFRDRDKLQNSKLTRKMLEFSIIKNYIKLCSHFGSRGSENNIWMKREEADAERASRGADGGTQDEIYLRVERALEALLPGALQRRIRIGIALTYNPHESI